MIDLNTGRSGSWVELFLAEVASDRLRREVPFKRAFKEGAGFG